MIEVGQTNQFESLSQQAQQSMIGALNGMISGICFGSIITRRGEEGNLISEIKFTAVSSLMSGLLGNPDFKDKIDSLTVGNKYLMKDTLDSAVVYRSQFVTDDGNIYDVKAKKIGDQYLYTANEIMQDIDPMTGLGTKHSLKIKLKEVEAMASRKKINGEDFPMAVIFADINDLKLYNDKYSHKAGDEAIIGAGKILQSSVREVDFVARIGGDEFVIVLDNPDLGKIPEIMERIETNIKKANNNIPDKGRHIRFSLGIASNKEKAIQRYCSPDDNITPEVIEIVADMKMYVEKKSNKIIREVQRSKNATTYSEQGYSPFVEDVFGLEKDGAWRIRQERLLTLVNILFKDNQFGPSKGDEAMAMYTKLKNAILFQDLFTYIKDEDYSIIEDEVLRRKKILDTTRVVPANKVHPQLAKDFVLNLKKAGMSGIDLDEIAKIVEYQHAWVNGSSSPVEKAPEGIPDAAKWLVLINEYSAMITNGYGDKRTPDQALEEIEKGKGTHFDSDKADNFIRVVKEFNETNPWDVFRHVVDI